MCTGQETPPNYNMSFHENSMDRLPVKTSQSSETVTTDKHRQTHRLYPSLPNIDRYECSSSGAKLHAVAEFHPKILLENTQQSEGSPHKSDVNMKTQILILAEQKNELLSINERWAKEYQTMVQYYKEKIQVLKAFQQRNHFEEKEGKNVTLNKLKLKVFKEEENTQMGEDEVSELLNAETEIKELQAQNSALIRKGQHQHEEILRLNKALKEALKASQPLEVSNETLQDLWKHQADVYKEDFLKERKDREKLKGKYLELEKKYTKVHNEVHVLRSQMTWTRQLQPACNCTCTNQAKCSNLDDHPVNRIQSHRRFTMDSKK